MQQWRCCCLVGCLGLSVFGFQSEANPFFCCFLTNQLPPIPAIVQPVEFHLTSSILRASFEGKLIPTCLYLVKGQNHFPQYRIWKLARVIAVSSQSPEGP